LTDGVGVWRVKQAEDELVSYTVEFQVLTSV